MGAHYQAVVFVIYTTTPSLKELKARFAQPRIAAASLSFPHLSSSPRTRPSSFAPEPALEGLHAMSNPSTVAVFPFDRLPDELIEAIARWVIAADWDYARDRVRSHRRYCSIMTCISKRWNRIVSPLLWMLWLPARSRWKEALTVTPPQSITIRPPDEKRGPDPSEIGGMLNQHAAEIRTLRVVCVEPTGRQTKWLLALFDHARDATFTAFSLHYEESHWCDCYTSSEDSYEADERIERLANCIAGEVKDLHCSFQCWSGCSRPDLSYALVEDLIQRMSCLRRLTVKVDRDWPQDERKDDEGADEVDDDLAAYRSLLQYAKARQLERLEVQGAKAWLTTSQDRRA